MYITRGECDTKLASQQVILLIGALIHFILEIHHFISACEHIPASFCQRKLASFIADKEFDSQFILQFFDGLAYGRLGDIQLSGGFGEAAELCSCDENPQIVVKHNHSVMTS